MSFSVTSFERRPQDTPAPAVDNAAPLLAGKTPIQSEIIGADGKAAGILTLLGIMFTTLARFGTELRNILHHDGPARVTCAILLAGFAGMGLCAVVQAFRTISPRFVRSKPSLAFFGEIARLSREEYIDRVGAMTMRDAVDQILLYNHTAATICVIKFKQLRRALRFFELAALSWMLLAALLLVRSFLA